MWLEKVYVFDVRKGKAGHTRKQLCFPAFIDFNRDVQMTYRKRKVRFSQFSISLEQGKKIKRGKMREAYLRHTKIKVSENTYIHDIKKILLKGK
ncbi:MAG: hypothetical protein NVS1B13_11610 [Flavisolibacter sp.]